jgi:hypothetical protein
MLIRITAVLVFTFLMWHVVCSATAAASNDSNICKPADVTFKNHKAMDLQKEYSPAHVKAASGNNIWAILLEGYSKTNCVIPIAGDSVIVAIQTEAGFKHFRSSAIDSDEQHWIERDNFTTRHIKPSGFRVAVILELPDSLSLSPTKSKFFVQLPLLAYSGEDGYIAVQH